MAISLALSDGLAHLSEQLEPFAAGSHCLNHEDAETLRRCIRLLHGAARELENEVSRHRWNEAARAERAEAAALATLSASNVVLFPVISRPFSDGRPGGAA